MAGAKEARPVVMSSDIVSDDPKKVADPPKGAGGGKRRAKTSNDKARQDNRAAYLFLLPWFLGLALITVGPMLASLYLSFTDYSILSSPNWIGLDNYEHMFSGDRRYLKSVMVTLVYVFVSVPMLLVMALFLATIMNTGLRFLPLYRAVFYLPSLLGTSVAIAILWRRVFGGEGLVNSFLNLFGFDGPSWIGHPDYALYTLIVLNVWTFGSAMIIFLAGLRQIPTSLYEAASVDGAGRVRRFLHITLPLLTPVIFFNLIFNIIGAFQAFVPAFIVSSGTGGPIDSTLFYTLYLYQEGFTQLDMGYASAMAWVLLLAIAVFTGLMFLAGKIWVFYGDEK